MNTAKEAIHSLIDNTVTRPLVAKALIDGRYLSETLYLDFDWCVSQNKTHISTYNLEVQLALITFLFGTQDAYKAQNNVHIELITL